MRVEYQQETQKDGILTVQGNTLRLETGFFSADDPLCCPSQIEVDVIGIKAGAIGIVSQTFHAPPATP